ATRLDAQHVAAWMQLGDAMLALGKAPAAVEAYARAVELAPAAPEARVALADALLQSGLTGQAELTLREGLQRQPDSPELCLTLGLLLQHTGRTAEAVELLRRAEAGGMQLESLGR
ncbi:MAG TPA: tetratricopeptide repeat protein, partial [Lacipirellulaceae bacterium]|nr:tetratricopeptide repeat protein [Lacipirellulaceae bacterium]